MSSSIGSSLNTSNRYRKIAHISTKKSEENTSFYTKGTWNGTVKGTQRGSLDYSDEV